MIKTFSEQEQLIKELLIRDRQQSYHLDQGNLLRLFLIKRHKKKYTCLISSHHAILDGWSNPLLLKFVHELICAIAYK